MLDTPFPKNIKNIGQACGLTVIFKNIAMCCWLSKLGYAKISNLKKIFADLGKDF
jgi:hypothetical protein